MTPFLLVGFAIIVGAWVQFFLRWRRLRVKYATSSPLLIWGLLAIATVACVGCAVMWAANFKDLH